MEGDRLHEEKILQEFDLDGQTATLIKASEGTISDSDIDLLLNNLIGTNFKLHEDITLPGVRHSIRGVIARVRGRIENLPLVSNLLTEKTVDRISSFVYPAPSRQEHMNGTRRTLLRMIKNGNVFVIKVEDQTIAMQAVKCLDGKIDGRPVFELTKSSTSPDYQRKGLAQRLAVQAFQEVMSDNPDAVWISMSRNAGLLEGIKAKGGHVYDIFDQTQEASRLMREVNGDYSKTLDHDGYKVIFFDPKVDEIVF